MVSFKHKFISAKADGGDSTLVKPSNWNDYHDAETAADGVVLGRAAGAGSGPVQELPASSLIPSGTVWDFAGVALPPGWLACDGALYVRADYPNLFTAIGTTYNIGGEATTQFRVPDCRGRVVAMADGGVGRLPGWVPGTAGGSSVAATGNIHSTGNVPYMDFGNLTFTQTYGAVAGASGGIGYQPGGGSLNFVQVNDPVTVQGYTHVAGGPFGGIGVDGSSANFSIIQPTIAMNRMIKT